MITSIEKVDILLEKFDILENHLFESNPIALIEEFKQFEEPIYETIYRGYRSEENPVFIDEVFDHRSWSCDRDSALEFADSPSGSGDYCVLLECDNAMGISLEHVMTVLYEELREQADIADLSPYQLKMVDEALNSLSKGDCADYLKYESEVVVTTHHFYVKDCTLLKSGVYELRVTGLN